jgi:hypothetical protein
MVAFSRRYAEENGAGVAVSLLLHGLLALLVLVGIARHAQQRGARPEPFVPVDLVHLADETRSPPAERHGAVPQQKSGHPQDEAASHRTAISPSGKQAVAEDALDTKLKALARLKQPNAPIKLASGQGVSTEDISNGISGDSAVYSIRDYVLAQVLRRWTVDLAKVKDRPLSIAIAVVMKRDGSIADASIIEQARAKVDAYYRDIALSARNAVLLSSPIRLPAGDYPKEMHFTLHLDTRAVLR